MKSILTIICRLLKKLLSFCDSTKETPGHEKYYFTPNEVIFQVVHPMSATANIVDAMRRFLRPDGNYSQPDGIKTSPEADRNWRSRLQLPSSDTRIITFASQTEDSSSQVFSLVPIRLFRVNSDDLKPDDVLSLLNDAYTELGDSFGVPASDGGVDIDVVGNDIKEGMTKPVKRFQVIPLEEAGGISIKSISPNWVASNLPHGKGTGGPGSLPTPLKPQPGSQNSPTIGDQDLEFKLQSGESIIASELPAGKPCVAILDTFQSSSAPRNSPPNHELQGYLFGSNPGLTFIRYSDPAELTRLEVFTPPNTHYEMPDHGTDIAGIIHTIAPNAIIRLYEVLNKFGVGSFISIAQGLLNAIHDRDVQHKGMQLILNCSFMLDDDIEDLVRNIPMLRDPNTQQLIRKSMRDVFTATTARYQKVSIVASAGNDAIPGEPRPNARYPAAFPNVNSVAASYMTNTGQFLPASYSNRPYSPEVKDAQAGCYLAFGGELDDPRRTNGYSFSSNGVLGVYIGLIPRQNTDGTFLNPGLVNSDGWVRWAGTSFAAALITGLLAKIGKAALDSAPYSTAPTAGSTVGWGHIVKIEQG